MTVVAPHTGSREPLRADHELPNLAGLTNLRVDANHLNAVFFQKPTGISTGYRVLHPESTKKVRIIAARAQDDASAWDSSHHKKMCV